MNDDKNFSESSVGRFCHVRHICRRLVFHLQGCEWGIGYLWNANQLRIQNCHVWLQPEGFTIKDSIQLNITVGETFLFPIHSHKKSLNGCGRSVSNAIHLKVHIDRQVNCSMLHISWDKHFHQMLLVTTR